MLYYIHPGCVPFSSFTYCLNQVFTAYDYAKGAVGLAYGATDLPAHELGGVNAFESRTDGNGDEDDEGDDGAASVRSSEADDDFEDDDFFKPSDDDDDGRTPLSPSSLPLIFL